LSSEILQRTFASTASDNWEPSGMDRAAYLDVAEHIVRLAADWLEDGEKIIDPVEHFEWGQSTSRFVSSAAVLISEGRCQDLQEPVLNSMSRCCRLLAAGEAESPDFWLRELMTAYTALHPAFPEEATQWARDLSAIVPETVYWQVEKEDVSIEDLHNWTVYAAAGEAMREAEGLAPASDDVVWGFQFFDKYLPVQLRHFTEDGMYRDPGDPITYDLTTRLQFALALEAGAGGAHKKAFDSLLEAGGRMTLLLPSPEGLVPFGGRSSQYNFQEIIVSALCEMEANRWKQRDPRLAGAFKRQAHLSLQAVRPWLMDHPMRSLKNRFPPQQRHGFDPYGKYAVYSLLAASFCVLAAQRADDTIEEQPCPAEIGGFLLPIQPAFHKVIANTGQSQVVLDTEGDPHYDATGLGRICFKGLPLPLILGMPLCGDPEYHLPEALKPKGPTALGPEWLQEGEWIRLAAENREGAEIELLQQEPGKLRFSVQYPAKVTEFIELGETQLSYRVHSEYEQMRLRIPLFVEDGVHSSQIHIQDHCVTVSVAEHRVRYEFEDGARLELLETPEANRNALYRILLVSGSDAMQIDVL